MGRKMAGEKGEEIMTNYAIGGEGQYYQTPETTHLPGCPYHPDCELLSACHGAPLDSLASFSGEIPDGFSLGQGICSECGEASDPLEECLCDSIIESLHEAELETKRDLLEE